ncbi:MAG: hypothetical protein AAGF74_14440 [Pseudomonadota bacterium]
MYCTPDELAEWLAAFCDDRGYGALAYVRSEQRPRVLRTVNLLFTSDLWRLFLVPVAHLSNPLSTLSDARPRELGWIDVEPGSLVDLEGARVLTLTEIHAEDPVEPGAEPVKHLRALKRKLRPQLTTGVRGLNPVTGGTADYHDISSTQGARQLHAAGVLWKQHSTYQPVFSPIATGE